MKNAIVIILLLLLLPCLTIAQTKGDNTIIINKKITTDDIKGILFMNGYIFVGNDTTYITTTSKSVHKTAVSVKLLLQKKDSTIYLKGLFKSLISMSIGSAKIEDDYSTIEFKGMKGSDYKDSWNEMDRIAKLLNGEIIYKKL